MDMYELFRRYGTALYARRAFQKCAERARDAVDYLERKGVFGKTAEESKGRGVDVPGAALAAGGLAGLAASAAAPKYYDSLVDKAIRSYDRRTRIPLFTKKMTPEEASVAKRVKLLHKAMPYRKAVLPLSGAAAAYGAYRLLTE